MNLDGMGLEVSSLGVEGEVKGHVDEQQLDTWEEEDYNCPICQDVLKTPIRTKLCHHVFCRDCFRMAVRALGPQCPMCRGPVEESQRRAVDIQLQMKTRSGRCRSCGTKRRLSRMRSHSRHCRKYIEEYGCPGGDPAVPVQTVAQLAPETTALEPFVSLHVHLGRGVYSCPYCTLPGLADLALVQHCLSLHREERTPKVCPICACTSWGVANYCSPNLIAHLARRHRFSYDAYMDTSVDEDTQLHRAVQLSVDEVGVSVRA